MVTCMNTKCPNCGAVASLDLLLTNDDARNAIAALAAISGELAKTTIRYCGLFRPAKSQLSFARLAALLNQLLPDIKAQRIERDGKVYEAPLEAWLHAMQVMLTYRDNHQLKLPLKSHGYLYEIIAGYKPDHSAVVTPAEWSGKPNQAPTGTTGGLAAYLQGKKR